MRNVNLLMEYYNFFEGVFETNETLPVTGSSSATNLELPPDARNAFFVGFTLTS